MTIIPGGNIYPRQAQCPVVDVIGDGRWRVYYAGRREGEAYISYFDVAADQPHKLLYDHKAPILPPGRIGTFDEHGMMPTWVGQVGDRKLLYYIGWQRQVDVPYRNCVGVVEVKGSYHKRIFTGPIMGVTRNDPYMIGTFCKHNDYAYYMSGCGWKDGDPLYHVKLAGSDNGIDWATSEDPIIKLAPGEGGICSVTVLDRETMLYCYRGDTDFRGGAGSYKIGLLRNGVRCDDEIDIPRSDWDSEMQCYPHVVQGTNILFYNGNGFGKTGIGYAAIQ